jgi:hypothetical protein
MIDRVTGPESFAAFIEALRATIKHNAENSGPFNAENFDIDDVLEAMQSWSSTQVNHDRIAEMNPWAAAARLLVVGHYYE